MDPNFKPYRTGKLMMLERYRADAEMGCLRGGGSSVTYTSANFAGRSLFPPG